MKIHVNTGGLAETNGYLLADEAAKKAAIIDAPQGTLTPLLDLARRQGWEVVYLFLTHGHWDHISDHAVVTQAFPHAQVLISRAEEPRLEHPGSMMFQLPYTIPPRKADGYLEDGQKLAVGGVEVEVLITPGHAAGHACLYVPPQGNEPGRLFAGDLLMAGSVGRYDFEDGNLPTLQRSLKRVLALPPETIVYSGHGPVTTIGQERATNPFVQEWGLWASQ